MDCISCDNGINHHPSDSLAEEEEEEEEHDNDDNGDDDGSANSMRVRACVPCRARR